MTCRPLLVLMLAVSVLVPAGVSAQVNLLGATGLGRRVRSLDARARGMGDAGVALHGGNLSAINPATAARFASSGIWATYMPEKRTVKGEFANGDLATEDVPVVRLVFPWGGRWAAAVSAGAYFDQDWGIQFIDTLNLSSGDFPFQETRTSDGGVTQFRLDMAGIVGEGLSLGGSFLFYSGQARRKVQRNFEAGSGLLPYSAEAAIDYLGWGLAVGAEWQPIPEMILGLTGSWGPGLDIENDTTGQKLEVGLPLTLDAGGSLQLTPDFLFALAFGWEGWSTVADDLPNAEASDAWTFGGGLELTALKGETSRLLVRGGAHATRLPFELRGGALWERGLSLGAGVVLREGRARMDTAVEFGKRGNIDVNDVEESYVRVSFGLAVFTR